MKKLRKILTIILVGVLVYAGANLPYGPKAYAAGTLTYLQSATSTTDAISYTFSSQNFGTASSDRYILAVITTRDSGSGAKTINSVVIGGVSASIVLQDTAVSSNTTLVGFALAAVPTGTSGDVVVIFSETMLRSTISLYAITGLNSTTPYDNEVDKTSTFSVALDIPDNGFAVGVSAFSDTSGSFSWTGLTENSDSGAGAESLRFSTASDTFVTGETGRTISVTPSATSDAIELAASWSFTGGGDVAVANIQDIFIFE